ncbi:MAG: hypothetical protein ACE1Y2_07145 [Stenotrophomonas maltophilia]
MAEPSVVRRIGVGALQGVAIGAVTGTFTGALIGILIGVDIFVESEVLGGMSTFLLCTSWASFSSVVPAPSTAQF